MTYSTNTQSYDPTTHRHCSHCNQVLPLSDFPKKRGGYAARCKASMREYSKSHYQTNAKRRIAEVASYKHELGAARMAAVEKLAKTKHCDRCGEPYASLKKLQTQTDRLALVGTLSDGKTLGMLASRQAPQSVFEAALADDQVVWRCRPCLASRPHDRPAPLAEAILANCKPGDGPQDIFKKLGPDFGSTLASVRVTISNMVKDGRLERIGRGRYQVPAR